MTIEMTTDAPTPVREAVGTATPSAQHGRLVAAVIDALTSVLPPDAGELTEQTGLFQELGLDSTSILDVLLSIEESLDTEFDTDELEMSHFSTVGSLVDFLSTVVDA
jgi:acyl carrier protein